MSNRDQKSEIGGQRSEAAAFYFPALWEKYKEEHGEANLKAEMEGIYRKMWMPVVERKPADNMLVLTCRAGLFDLGHLESGRWVDEASGHTMYDVTHWMSVIGPEVQS